MALVRRLKHSMVSNVVTLLVISISIVALASSRESLSCEDKEEN